MAFLYALATLQPPGFEGLGFFSFRVVAWRVLGL